MTDLHHGHLIRIHRTLIPRRQPPQRLQKRTHTLPALLGQAQLPHNTARQSTAPQRLVQAANGIRKLGRSEDRQHIFRLGLVTQAQRGREVRRERGHDFGVGVDERCDVGGGEDVGEGRFFVCPARARGEAGRLGPLHEETGHFGLGVG